MSSLRRSLLRRYRLSAPQLLRNGLILLVALLLCDGVAALYVPQIQAGISLTAPASSQSAGGITIPAVASVASQSVLASDNFSRTNQTYWGMATDGQTWQADAQKTHSFSISGDQGKVSATDGFLCGVLGPVVVDSEVLFNASVSDYSQSRLGAVLRWNSPRDFYEVVLSKLAFTLSRVVDGMEIPLDVVSLTPRNGALYTFLFRATGGQLAAMVWPTGQPAPTNWQISLLDSALGSGRAGIGASIQPGAQARISDFKEVDL